LLLGPVIKTWGFLIVNVYPIFYLCRRLKIHVLSWYFSWRLAGGGRDIREKRYLKQSKIYIN
jgi:hypothetical protein